MKSVDQRQEGRSRRFDWIVETFTGWRFPAFALSLIVVYEAAVLVMLFLPITDDALGRFAEEFKTWCFGYDPATGRSQPMYLILMLTEPLILGAVLAAVYWKQLAQVVREPLRLLPPAGIAALILLGSFAFLFQLSEETLTRGELPFPAERVRTAYLPPPFEFVDHEGAPLSLRALEGKVVVLTGIYASCAFTCPMLLAQAKRAFAQLDPTEQDQVSFVAITLDPKTDTPEVLAKLASGQGISAPAFHLVTGEPAKVEGILDRLGIERRRDPATGVIDHTNLFLLVDRGGRIAYRFTLGERQERWLITALQQLVAEPPLVN